MSKATKGAVVAFALFGLFAEAHACSLQSAVDQGFVTCGFVGEQEPMVQACEMISSSAFGLPIRPREVLPHEVLTALASGDVTIVVSAATERSGIAQSRFEATFNGLPVTVATAGVHCDETKLVVLYLAILAAQQNRPHEAPDSGN